MSSLRNESVGSGTTAGLVRDRDHIALSAHRGEDIRPAPVVLELAPQVTDVAVDEVAVRLGVGSPDAVDDVLARHDATGVRDEHVKESALERCEMRRAAVQSDVPATDVDVKLADLYVAIELGETPGRAMDRLARADDQLGGVERDPEDLGGAHAD